MEIPTHEIQRIKAQINEGISLERIAIAFSLNYPIIKKIDCGYKYANVEPLTQHQIEIEKAKESRMEYEKNNPMTYPPPQDSFIPFNILGKNDFDAFLKILSGLSSFPKIKILINTQNHDAIKEVAYKRKKQLESEKVKTEYDLMKCRLMIDAIENDTINDLPPDCIKELEDLREEIKRRSPKLLMIENKT